MSHRLKLRGNAVAILPLLLLGACAHADDPRTDSRKTNRSTAAVPTNTSSPEGVLVTGQRASLASAQAIKRDASNIVDAVVADDIVKLPDTSVAEAMQRIAGVQIGRDRGDGTAVTIRGLMQVQTTLNGREIFTAGSGRTLDFADVPSEMVAAIHVAKTAAADQIEGGIGGSVDLVTRRPLDFDDGALAGSIRHVSSDLADRDATQFTALASKRWAFDNGGEFGALITLADQPRAFREDQQTLGRPTARTDIVPGTTVYARDGVTETTSVGERRRRGFGINLQWRPHPDLELHAESHYVSFHTRQDSHQISVRSSPTFLPGSAELFPGTHDIRRITWTDAPASILSFARDTLDRSRQLAGGAVWQRNAWRLSADLSRTESENRLFFSGPFFSARVAEFSQDMTGNPDSAVEGTDLLNPSNLAYTGVAYRKRIFVGDLTAARLDASYQFERSWVDSLSGGLRLARRGADNKPGLISGDAVVTGLTAADTPGIVAPNPYRHLFPGYGVGTIGDFLTGDIDLARNDPQALRDLLGITQPIPASASPQSLWEIDERTDAIYVKTASTAAALPLTGDFGLRAVMTRARTSSAELAAAAANPVPVTIRHRDIDYLPSANLRYALTPRTYLRAAASRTLARPNFDQLSPSLVLIPNSIDPVLNVGVGGNPTLRPIYSSNIDLAVEHYRDDNTAVHLSIFHKDIDGFVTTVTAPELHNGTEFTVSRPQNADEGRVDGAEFGYQQFYSHLPGWLSGLGLQLNYTWLDSATQNREWGRRTQLQNLSRHSANAIAMYERGPISARLAYSWRDDFLSRVATLPGIGAVPVYAKGYGWLDASLKLRVHNNITFALEGTNLLRTLRSTYYGTASRPESHWLNDRQISIGATVQLP